MTSSVSAPLYAMLDEESISTCFSALCDCIFVDGLRRAVSYVLRAGFGWEVVSLHWFLVIHLFGILYTNRSIISFTWEKCTRDGPGELALHSELISILSAALGIAVYLSTCLILLLRSTLVCGIRGHPLTWTGFIVAIPALIPISIFAWLRLGPEERENAYADLTASGAVSLRIAQWRDTIYEMALRLSQFLKEWFASKRPNLMEKKNESTRARFEYKYDPIDTQQKEFRLLRVTKPTPFSRPSLALISVPISLAPPYEAISYTWDGQVADHDLELDGGGWIRVTENVLKIIFERPAWKRVRHLWIDSICINQPDDIEKNGQVQLMSEIYSSAERVVVCLDVHKSKRGDATRLFSLHQRLTIAANDPEMQGALPVPNSHDIGTDRQWQAFIDFFYHPYWARTWILQEIALGRVVHLIYGGQYVSLDHHIQPVFRILDDTTVLLIVAQEMERRNQDTFSFLRRWEHLCKIFRCRERVKRHDLFALGEFLGICQASTATDSRDKVFGLQALVKESEKITPNYKVCVRDLYLDVAHKLLVLDPWLVFERSSLDFPTKVECLPSWVPDWSCMTINKYESAMVYAPGSSSYHAGGSSPNKPRILTSQDNRSRLSLECFPISEIQYLGPSWVLPPMGELLADPTACEPLFDSKFKQVFSFLSNPGGRAEDNQLQSFSNEAVWRTMIRDTHRDSAVGKQIFPAPAEYGDYFRTCCEQILDVPSQAAGVSAEKPESSEQDELNMQKFSLCMSYGLDRQKLATARDGTMIVAPLAAEVGDRLVVVPGFPMPLLLRKKTIPGENREELDIWTHVGTCYAHGFMQGEALTRTKATLILE